MQPTFEGNDNWLDDDEKQMQAEDALWESMYAQHAERFADLFAAAQAEIAAGETLPMFNDDGAWLMEEYLEQRAQRGSKEKFLSAMEKVADVEPLDERDRL